jgi:hypothetical protein
MPDKADSTSPSSNHSSPRSVQTGKQAWGLSEGCSSLGMHCTDRRLKTKSATLETTLALTVAPRL